VYSLAGPFANSYKPRPLRRCCISTRPSSGSITRTRTALGSHHESASLNGVRYNVLTESQEK
jgi:hypothetical protein